MRAISFVLVTALIGCATEDVEPTDDGDDVDVDGKLDSPDSADIIFSFRWTDTKNQWGIPGSFVAEGRRPGFGTHASLSRFDMHNTLVAAGPDFRQGLIDSFPTGNADVAPTILSILGVKPKMRMDGRVLEEALIHGKEPAAPVQKTIRAEADTGVYQWSQHLKFSTIGNQIYFDEGNGEPILK